jgi:AcrR family transcriptional regulator
MTAKQKNKRRSGKRRYTMGRRAEQQKQTRARIVKAAVELHEKLGPRNATISAIAKRAGVQRLTVYRHFPDDTALF